MAKFSYHLSNDLMEQLKKIENTDEIATKMIKAGQPIVEKELKRRSASHKVTGKMESSIVSLKIKRRKSGIYVGEVSATGWEDKGSEVVRNMEKMAYLEYGTSHQPSMPVITPTVEATEARVLDAMEQVFNREVGSG